MPRAPRSARRRRRPPHRRRAVLHLRLPSVRFGTRRRAQVRHARHRHPQRAAQAAQVLGRERDRGGGSRAAPGGR